MTYYQQMSQWLDIHTAGGRGGETEAQGHRLYIFFLQKETQNGSQTEVENGESIKLLEDITGEQLDDF